MGELRKRGGIWQIRYYRNGIRYEEGCGSSKKRVASTSYDRKRETAPVVCRSRRRPESCGSTRQPVTSSTTTGSVGRSQSTRSNDESTSTCGRISARAVWLLQLPSPRTGLSRVKRFCSPRVSQADISSAVRKEGGRLRPAFDN